ncbi:DNA methylase [Ahniella affigens]|uniref:DNA-3-methyladenine glycosylase II n=1 Tax=Ahniella affigens TaxID=2021234 RepID=A0A2P1PSM8_9GAMM|nr:AlkA N-terminal domain-containing protein [Ahniella affigens]AVP97840.1 DNA methylase [Ahniella affigens]
MSTWTDAELSVFEDARKSRDRRFDGMFFIAVRSTRIYCRPICPAPAPLVRNITYFRTAGEAQAAGYRPCLRCRPEIAPEDHRLRLVDDLIEQAWLAIQEGALDRQSPTAFAKVYGLSERQLRRQFLARWQITPAEAAATRRLHLAKQLLTETDRPVTEIALAAGYRSIRGFNGALQSSLGMNPLRLRKQLSGDRRPGVCLRLPYRPPYDWAQILEFLRLRALPAVESVQDDAYHRVLKIDGAFAHLSVRHLPKHACLELQVDGLPTALVPKLARRVRLAFDLDADPLAIAAVLERDPRLRELVKNRPGLRLPVGLDAFETGVRAILGQQISVAATRTLLNRLLVGEGAHLAIPDPASLAARAPETFGIPLKRAEAVRAFAAAVANGQLSLSPIQTLAQFTAQAVALPGIGPWTANYMAMRAIGAPDAFVVDDLIIKRRLGVDKAAALLQRVERWRPWRAYGVLYCWSES